MEQIIIIIMVLAMVGVMSSFIMFIMISSTIGFKFLGVINRAKKLKKKGYGLIKVFSVSGHPEYILSKFNSVMSYEFKENDQIKKKMVLYDNFAKYEDFGANIPIIEANPNDILPKNYLTGNSINTNPELVTKTITDSGRTAEELDNLKAWRKWLLIIGGGAVVGGVFLFDSYSGRLAESSLQVAEMAKLCAQQAVITTQ